MKKFFLMLSSILLLVTLISSCKEDSLPEVVGQSSDVSIQSILAYAESVERERDTLDVSFNNKLDTIIFTTRTLYTEDAPVDISKVKLFIEPAKGATSDISDGYYDMTREDNTITITAEDGTKRELGMRIVVTPHEEKIPELNVTISEVWTKTGSELGLKHPKTLRAMTIYKDYILILDNKLDYDETAKIKAYDKLTGEFVQDVKYYYGGWPSTDSFVFGLSADDAGNFAVSRYNYGGAGFRLDVYSSLDAVPITPILCTAAEVPDFIGRKLNVVGDLKGKAVVTTPTASVFAFEDFTNVLYDTYTTWNINEGNPVNKLPVVMNYAQKWHGATIQRASVDDPTFYVSYNDEPSFPNDPMDTWGKIYGCHFAVYDPESGSLPLEINQKNFSYRILEHKVLHFGPHKLLFTLEQGYALAGSTMKTALFNITNKKHYGMQPGVEGYDKFMLYKSKETFADNAWRLGNVAAWVNEDSTSAYFYAIYPGDNENEPKLTLLRVDIKE